MLRHPLARLVALFVALWLPFQAVAAMELAACAHGGKALATHAAEGDLHAAHHHADHDADSGGPAVQPQGAADDCATCGACHLACSGFLAAPVFSATPTYSARHVLAPTASPLADQTSPDRLRRPPRPAA